jgi:hypothetical protein
MATQIIIRLESHIVEAKRMAVLRRFAVRGVSIGTGNYLGVARLIIHQIVLERMGYLYRMII